MPLNFVINNTCPTCGSTIRHAVIDLHPTDRDAAIHSLKCADCAYKKTRVLSLRPDVPPPELTAKRIEEAASIGGLTSRHQMHPNVRRDLPLSRQLDYARGRRPPTIL
jgi:C4-type Zn-finger protein